jgi:hypothetical protein
MHRNGVKAMTYCKNVNYSLVALAFRSPDVLKSSMNKFDICPITSTCIGERMQTGFFVGWKYL